MELEPALRQASFEVFEDGLFLFLDEAEGDEECPIRYSMRISSDGARLLELGLAASPGAGAAMAANLLGSQGASLAGEDVAAAVAEALNMVAGKAVAYALGTSAEPDLEPPVGGGEPRGHVLSFLVDGGRLQVWCSP